VGAILARIIPFAKFRCALAPSLQKFLDWCRRLIRFSSAPFLPFVVKGLKRACPDVLKSSPVFSIEEAQSLAHAG